MSKQTIDSVLGPVETQTSPSRNKQAKSDYWDSFDCQIQCEEYERYMGYGEDTYNAIQEYLSEQNSALY